MGGKKAVEPGVTEDVCCPFEEVQVLTMMIQNPGSAAPQPPKRLDEGTVLQADSDCIYIGGKYKLPWKKVTHLQIIVAADSGGDACFHVSTVPVDEGNVPTGKGYKVAARLGTDPRTGRPPLQQWAAFSRFVEKKWNKKQRRLARKEAEALEEERQQQQTKTMTSRSRSYKPSRSKASKFLAKNAKNIKDWDSDDDEVFNRQPHRELLSAQKKRRQLQEEEEASQEDNPVDMDDDEEDDGEHQATFDNSEEMPPSSDLDGEVEDHKAAQAKKQKPRRLKRKRRDDDDSDDENLFDDSAPDLTTPMAKRVVTPGTTSFRKSVLDDDDDDENDGEQEMDEETKNSSVATTKSKTSKKGPGSITSFFAPRAKPAATQTQDRKEQSKGESPGKSEKEQESEVPAPQKKAESSKDFFAPRRSTVVANTSESKDQASDPQDEDDATVGSTPPTEVPTQYYDSGDEELDSKDNTQTPLKNVSSQKKPFSSSSRFAYESAKKLEQDDDPIMEFDTDLVSPSKKSSTALVVGTSPLASRLSGQKRRLFPRKGYYGSKPPTKTATLALEMADHQSPRRNPFAGMGPISSSTKKTTKPVGSPLSPIRARPPLPSSPKSPIQSVPPPPKWVGLRNLGNTCYINASLQMLYSVPSFVGNLFPFRPGHRLVSSFCATYQNVIHPKEGKEGSATARGLKMAMDAKTNKFLGYQQRDAHEFLGDLIDQMHEEIETHEETKEEEKKDDGPLSSPFPSSKGQVLPTDDFFRLDVEVCLKCKSCGYSRTKEEMYRYLSVDIDALEKSNDTSGLPSKPAVKGCLENFFQPEDREIKCEKCKDGTAATQTMRILSRPKALLVHLKRFKMVEKPIPRKEDDARPPEMEISFQKNRAQVELTAKLSLDTFMSSKKVQQSSALPSNYALQSIVHHIGNTADSGHYTADALRYKTKDGKDDDDDKTPENDDQSTEPQWVSYDDGVTTETTLQDVRASAKNQRTAYMLLYSAV